MRRGCAMSPRWRARVHRASPTGTRRPHLPSSSTSRGAVRAVRADDGGTARHRLDQDHAQSLGDGRQHEDARLRHVGERVQHEAGQVDGVGHAQFLRERRQSV